MQSSENQPTSNRRKKGRPKTQMSNIEPEPEQFIQNPLSLKTLCVLNLSDEDTDILDNYHDEFRENLKKKLWQEVITYPEPLAYRISDKWL